jgi:hypothetical protein
MCKNEGIELRSAMKLAGYVHIKYKIRYGEVRISVLSGHKLR